MSEMTRGRGRPTDYDPKYCELVVELAKQGRGIAEWADNIDVCIQTIRNWKSEHPEFLAATNRAATALQAWWENAGRVGMVSDKFNSAVWAKNMHCRFKEDWREETTNTTKLEAGDSFAALLGKVASKSVFPSDDERTPEA